MLEKILNVKLGTKIFGGFGMLLALLAIVSSVGLGALLMVVNNRHKADIADEQLRTILEARRHEKNFVIRGNDEYVEKVDALVADLRKKAEQSESQADSEGERKLLGQTLKELNKYITGFHEYVDSKKTQNGALADMEAKSIAALLEVESILADQKSQLDGLLKKTADSGSNEEISDRRGKMEDANRIAKLLLEAGSFEKEYVASGDKKHKAEVEKRMAKLLDIAGDLRSKFRHQTNITQADKVSASIGAYSEALSRLAELVEQRRQPTRKWSIPPRPFRKSARRQKPCT